MVCAVCGEKFGGITAFDMHRVGKFPVANPRHPVPVGEAAKQRRCLTAREMMEAGLRRDGKGKWCRTYPLTLQTPQAKKRIAA